LVAGDLVSNARSKVVGLQACDADPLPTRHLAQARWGLAHAPTVTAWDEAAAPTACFDISGCAHLAASSSCWPIWRGACTASV
jgi:hypothetical protein